MPTAFSRGNSHTRSYRTAAAALSLTNRILAYQLCQLRQFRQFGQFRQLCQLCQCLPQLPQFPQLTQLIEAEVFPAWPTLWAFSVISWRTFATRWEKVSLVVSFDSGLATAVFVVPTQAISCIAAASIEAVFRMIYLVSTMNKSG